MFAPPSLARCITAWDRSAPVRSTPDKSFCLSWAATSEHFTQALLWPARKFAASSACAMLVMPAANSKTPSALTWSGRSMAAALIATGDDGSRYGEETARLYQCRASTLTTRSLPSNSLATRPPDALNSNVLTRSFTGTVALRMMSRPWSIFQIW